MNPPEQSPDDRVQEAEIRLAFLERELELYKDAVQTLHARLEHVEHLLARLRQRAEDSTPAPGIATQFQDQGECSGRDGGGTEPDSGSLSSGPD